MSKKIMIILVVVIAVLSIGLINSQIFSKPVSNIEFAVSNHINSDQEFTYDIKSKKINSSNTIMTVQQTYNRVPIYGSMLKITVDTKTNEIINQSGSFITGLGSFSLAVNKQISDKQALSIVESCFKTKPTYSSTPTISNLLYVKTDGNKAISARCTWVIKFSINEPKIGLYEYIIDANTGTIITVIDKLNYATGTNDTNTGIGVIGDTKTFDVTKSSSNGYYYLQDNTRGKGIITYDAKNSQYSSKETYDTDGVWNTEYQKALVDAHKYAEVTYDYYKNTFGRNSYDNLGAVLKSVVHYGSKYNNAFWDGTKMTYGDGDGKTFVPLSGSLDVVAHELTHAVTGNEADLVYQNESGALSEAYSDIFGTLVEFTYKGDKGNWVVGEDIYVPDRVNGLRSLSDPSKTDNPDHYSKIYKGTQDNGGVHINCGVINKCAYLISEGGTHYNITVTGIGKDKLGNILYNTLINSVTSNMTFAQFKTETVKITTNLYGENSSELESVNNAFKAVGL